ncbi:NAD-dependent epimerase/dehydratase family protein [Vibrio gangliei]|uniref:NAD-dependent epimerase/dehydratase family protein n=1 Tax=Vibrio gangliei TaxID=2077090 RepID=UPI000D01AF58|nr:NAD(P)H-binding protein [Vibrio gangliei]
MRLLIVGATGLVGSHVLQLALDDERVTKVIAPVRRPLAEHPKLDAPLIDYNNIKWSWGDVDAVICTLGTTIKTTGSKQAFYRVDHDYPLMIATLAQQHGCKVYVLNSATGANANSKIFYNQVKGKLEQDLKALDFRSLTLVQPGLIGGKRSEFRFGEHVFSLLLRLLHPVLPKSWRISPVENIAKALVKSAMEAKPGCHAIEAKTLAN